MLVYIGNLSCVLQLLFQETNPGVRYEYTINQNDFEDNNIPASVFFWKYGSWTECSVTCGTGKRNNFRLSSSGGKFVMLH